MTKNIPEGTEPLTCTCCGDVFGYARRYEGKGAITETYNEDGERDDNLDFEILPGEDWQYITDKHEPGYVCLACKEGIQESSRIKILATGRFGKGMIRIGHFDPRCDVIYVPDTGEHLDIIDQDFIDILKAIIKSQKNNRPKGVVELKKFNSLSYCSIDDKDREYMRDVLKRLAKNNRNVVVNLQDSIGYCTSNEWFVITPRAREE